MANSLPRSQAEPSTPIVPGVPHISSKNPAYPQRTHIAERAQWQEVLASCDKKIARALQKLGVLGNTPSRAIFERLYAQMLGARDQVAFAARRLPGETGDLYEEDHHKLEEAVAALDRTLQKWDAQTS